MLREMLCSTLLLALIASTQGRAVNISNTWVLPEEGFPVFYRYFRDRISWYEADAVCQFHHANLVTVDTTGQYDAVRAYLKELDISSAVWVGLIRSNPDGEFTWTDYRGLSNDGYWSSAPDARAAPLCAAADPAADYRWQARACGGPTVASFICELPVPQWALGNEGCMLKALPALTVLYLPESAAVQLTADCGLTGVKRVQCTGNVKREDLLKNMSCAEYDTSAVSGTPAATEFAFNFTDEDATSDVTSEENVSTGHETIAPKLQLTEPTTAPVKLQSNQDTQTKVGNELAAKLKKLSYKNINLDTLHDNNLQSNDIPKHPEQEDLLSIEETQKLEDEKNMQHKLLHDELAQHGNFETIFSQPADHFVPPLVMAKAKVSDDMTILSLAEKHAQQIAEQLSMKHYLPFADMKPTQLPAESPNKDQIIDKTLVTIQQHNKLETKVEKNKQRLPKKYLSKEKYDGVKAKPLKIDNKLAKFEKTTTEAINIESQKTTSKDEIAATVISKIDKMYEDISLGPDVAINQSSTKEVLSLFNGQKTTESSSKLIITSEMTTKPPTETPSMKPLVENITLNHEIIKITFINDKLDGTTQTETVIEVTTRIPEAIEENKSATLKSESEKSTTFRETATTKVTNIHDAKIEEKLTTGDDITTDAKARSGTEYLSTKTDTVTQQTPTITTEILTRIHTNESTDIVNVGTVTTEAVIAETATKEKIEIQNITEEYNEDDGKNSNLTFEIDYSQSPLLSAANEPLHRPSRIRRPQIQPNRKSKFNPFRMLG